MADQNYLLEMKDNVTSPNDFVVATIKIYIFTFVIATLQMIQALNLAKSKIEIIFMFVIFTLHETWLPYFLSIPCI